MKKYVNSQKVAIVHDWLIGGGAEKVVYELHKMFPEAPIYTSYCTDEWRKKLNGKVVTGYLQHFGKLRKILVLPRIWWYGNLKFDEFDLVISTSGNGEAFSINTNPKTLHINYCHTPTHYYWRHYELYSTNPGFGIFNPLIRLILRLLVAPLRKWDYKAAQKADVVLANSTHIQKDIKTYYNRESEVLFPPVDVTRFSKAKPPKKDFFLSLGRQVPHKKVDLVIKACNELKLPLLVVGNGPENSRLQAMAGPTITFDTSRVSDDKVAEYMASAKAFIFPSLEDFGIAPVEAMASGTPVIAYNAGGALDYIKPGVTGEFFDEQTVESLVSTLAEFQPKKYNPVQINEFSREFSVQNFQQNIRRIIKDNLSK